MSMFADGRYQAHWMCIFTFLYILIKGKNVSKNIMYSKNGIDNDNLIDVVELTKNKRKQATNLR